MNRRMPNGTYGGVRGRRGEPAPYSIMPGMGDVSRVEVPNGGWRHQPLAEGKGVTAMWGLKEAKGKVPADEQEPHAQAVPLG